MFQDKNNFFKWKRNDFADEKIKVTYIVVLALVVFVVLMIVTLNDMGVHNLKELDTETFEILHKANSNSNLKETFDGVIID